MILINKMKQPKDLVLLGKINLILNKFSMGQIEGVSEIFLDSEPKEILSILSFFDLASQLSEEGKALLTDKLLEKLKPGEGEDY